MIRFRAILMCLAASAPVMACDSGSRTPTSPESSRELIDVAVSMAASVVGRHSSGREWRFNWNTDIAGAPPGEGRSPTIGDKFERLPAPVSVLDVTAVFTGPDGGVLQRDSTSAQQLIAGYVGGNRVLTNRSIFVSYNGHFVFETPPAPTAESPVLLTVRLQDGDGRTHVIETPLVLRYQDPPPRPCDGGRGIVHLTVRITSAGFEPRSARVSRGPCVIFINDDNVTHDIRSDPHPGHGSCPEFNVGVVAPGRQGSTTSLQTFGVCAYHDELRPGVTAFRGEIEAS